MIIGVFGDTHGSMYAVKRVLSLLKDADAWVFLGDGESEALWLEEESGKPVYRVKGNCDHGNSAQELDLTLGGVRILATHGHRFGVSYSRDSLGLRAEELNCAVALYAHTHVSSVEAFGGVLMLCPGSPALPRLGQRPSFAKLEIRDGAAYPSIITL